MKDKPYADTDFAILRRVMAYHVVFVCRITAKAGQDFLLVIGGRTHFVLRGLIMKKWQRISGKMAWIFYCYERKTTLYGCQKI
jgi:hypothetical protein